MATIEEGRLCRLDADCSAEQYCYEVSGQCVDYTLCNRYNRAESAGRARHPSLCGDCLPGYTAEVLGTGEKAILCKKINVQEKADESAMLSNAVISWIIIGTFFAVMMVTAACLWRKRLCSMRQKKKPKQWTELCIVSPTAPPAENSPFIEFGDRAMTQPFNNNQNLKDKNNLVRAVPCKEPNWIRTNPDYEHNMSDENLNVSSQMHSLPQLLPTDNNSNSWVPEQLTIQVANANLSEYGVEERDNTVNTALVQANYPSTSGGTGNTNNGNRNNNNSSGSTSESNDTQNSRERVRASNILITQKISMNVNVLNGD